MNNIINFPMFITWSITSKCNLRCKHCFRDNYEEEQLDKKMIKQIVDYLIKKGVLSVVLTGGEPLLSSNFKYIVKYINKRIKVGIATNGTLLTPELIFKLKEEGIRNYQISVEGSNADVNDYIRGAGTFDKIIKAIKILKENNCHVTLAMTITQYNFNDIKNNVLDFAQALDIDVLRLESFVPIGNGKKSKNKLFTIADDVDNLCQMIKSQQDEYSFKIKIPSFDKKYGCGAGIYYCVINSDLSLSPCDLLTHIIRTDKINIPEDIERLWNESPVFNNWREMIVNTKARTKESITGCIALSCKDCGGKTNE